MPRFADSAVGELSADPTTALEHYERLLALETDCWDVHAAIVAGRRTFVLLDVRSRECFEAGHVAGAVSLPHASISERSLAAFPADSLIVVYCSGPHCNGADRAAARLARMGRRVKKMIGGVQGWRDEGFSLTTGEEGTAGPPSHTIHGR